MMRSSFCAVILLVLLIGEIAFAADGDLVRALKDAEASDLTALRGANGEADSQNGEVVGGNGWKFNVIAVGLLRFVVQDVILLEKRIQALRKWTEEAEKQTEWIESTDLKNEPTMYQRKAMPIAFVSESLKYRSALLGRLIDGKEIKFSEDWMAVWNLAQGRAKQVLRSASYELEKASVDEDSISFQPSKEDEAIASLLAK